MRQSAPNSIDFPAQPFVAFADFLVVLLLILIVTVVYQSISSSSLVERAAIANMQSQLNKDVTHKLPIGEHPLKVNDPMGRRKTEKDFQEIYVDGDLQRFRLRGALSFAWKSPYLTPKGKAILNRFAQELASRQGIEADETSRPFKRIIVNGWADTSEGNEQEVWALSSLRAQEAIRILRNAHIYPKLMEASGRGSFEAALNSEDDTRDQLAIANRRLEIVIVYSGKNALHYIEKHGIARGTDGSR